MKKVIDCNAVAMIQRNLLMREISPWENYVQNAGAQLSTYVNILKVMELIFTSDRLNAVKACCCCCSYGSWWRSYLIVALAE